MSGTDETMILSSSRSQGDEADGSQGHLAQISVLVRSVKPHRSLGFGLSRGELDLLSG